MTRLRQGLAIGGLIAVFAGCSPRPESVTVAFFGDQGLSDDARAVLRMVVEEGADLVLHQGDVDDSGHALRYGRPLPRSRALARVIYRQS